MCADLCAHCAHTVLDRKALQPLRFNVSLEQGFKKAAKPKGVAIAGRQYLAHGPGGGKPMQHCNALFLHMLKTKQTQKSARNSGKETMLKIAVRTANGLHDYIKGIPGNTNGKTLNNEGNTKAM